MPPGRQKPHVSLTLEEKAAVLKHKKQNPGITQSQLVDWIQLQLKKHINRTTVSKILSSFVPSDDNENEKAKRRRNVQEPDLERALLEWFLRHECEGVMTDELLQAKGKQIAGIMREQRQEFHELTFSNGWLQSFKKRHNIKSYKKHGESGSTDQVAAARELPNLREVTGAYDLKDIQHG